MTPFKQNVIDVVKTIPTGKITSFGRISKVAGGTAQSVGWVLSGMGVDESIDLPWHRVVAADGTISALKLGDKGRLQKIMLLEEGFQVAGDKVVLSENIWYDPINE